MEFAIPLHEVLDDRVEALEIVRAGNVLQAWAETAFLRASSFTFLLTEIVTGVKTQQKGIKQ